ITVSKHTAPLTETWMSMRGHQLLLNSELTADLIRPGAPHRDEAGRFEDLPAHVRHRELARQRRRLERHEGEYADDLLERANGAVAGLEATALERAALKQAIGTDLVQRHRRCVHIEHGVEAHLTVDGDGHL